MQRQQQQQQEQQKSTSAATTTTSAWAKRVARVLHRKQSAPNHRQFSQQLSPTLPSVNTRLASVFAVLNMEKDMLPKLLGVSAFGMQDVHARLVTFKRELEARYHLRRARICFIVNFCFISSLLCKETCSGGRFISPPLTSRARLTRSSRRNCWKSCVKFCVMYSNIARAGW